MIPLIPMALSGGGGVIAVRTLLLVLAGALVGKIISDVQHKEELEEIRAELEEIKGKMQKRR